MVTDVSPPLPTPNDAGGGHRNAVIAGNVHQTARVAPDLSHRVIGELGIVVMYASATCAVRQFVCEVASARVPAQVVSAVVGWIVVVVAAVCAWLPRANKRFEHQRVHAAKTDLPQPAQADAEIALAVGGLHHCPAAPALRGPWRRMRNYTVFRPYVAERTDGIKALVVEDWNPSLGVYHGAIRLKKGIPFFNVEQQPFVGAA